MQITTMKKLLSLLLLITMPYYVYALEFIDADEEINNLEETVNQLKNKTPLPILFPAQVPKPSTSSSKEYYAGTWDNNDNQQYTLFVDFAKDCQGAHYCNVGKIIARLGKNPEIFYNQENQEITVQVPLAKRIKGYYTPAHAMGSYFADSIQWRDENILYTLYWQINAKQKPEDVQLAMIHMANSAIMAGAYQ